MVYSSVAGGFTVPRTAEPLRPVAPRRSAPNRGRPMYHTTADDVVIADHALWTRDDADFFALLGGTRAVFPPVVAPTQQVLMARARCQAMERGERFDPVRYLHEQADLDPDRFDAGLVALALDFYGRRRQSMLRAVERPQATSQVA